MNYLRRYFVILITGIIWVNAQIPYDHSQEGNEWLRTTFLYPNNPGNHPEDSSTDQNPWDKWTNARRVSMDHTGGIILHYSNFSDVSTALYQDSDLIGSGALTYYQFQSGGLKLVNSMFFTYDQKEAIRGYVRTIKDVTMYTNQAFIEYEHEGNEFHSRLKLGRDHLKISHGLKGALFLSDFSHPFDQGLIEIKRKNVSGLISVIDLDAMEDINRTLYVHALTYSSRKFSVTLGESLLKTSQSSSLDLSMLNPVHLWTWEEDDDKNSNINGFLYGGFSWFPKESWRFFGELIIDDINFHHPNAFYLNRFGFLGGLQKTQIPFPTSNFWIEYSNVLNQVYQSFRPQHIYTHRNFPIGHYLGNDFDNWHIHYTQLTYGNFMKPFFDITYWREGFDRLNTPFENSWEDDEGNFLPEYIPPPHPVPPVTYNFSFEAGAEVSLRKSGFVVISVFYQQNTFESITKKDWGINLRIWAPLMFSIE